MFHALTLADVAAHAGIGAVFLCTQGCVRRFCKHNIARFALGGSIFMVEAVVVTAVVG